MRAPILLLLLACLRKSLCDTRDMVNLTTNIFGPPPIDESSKDDSTGVVVEDDIPPCGIYRDPTHGTLTANGTEAGYMQYPWMVALYSCWKYRGGGSLINMNVVLTAAHIVLHVRRNTLKARAGDWDLRKKNEMFLYQERLVTKVIRHNSYKHSIQVVDAEYDAALLVLETPYSKADNVRTICLPQPDLVFSANCRTAGWGKTINSSTTQHEAILKVVDLEPVDALVCKRALSWEAQTDIRLHESFMCAIGAPGKDSCQGDGGSPLMCLRDTGYYYQRGIVSWGLGCGRAGVPGVYSDVVKIRNWIDDQMALNNFNPKSYVYVPFAKR